MQERVEGKWGSWGKQSMISHDEKVGLLGQPFERNTVLGQQFHLLYGNDIELQ